MAVTDDADDGAGSKVHPREVREGTEIVMRVNLHGLSDDVRGVEYNDEKYRCEARGTVVEAPGASARSQMENGLRPLANFVIETEDGHRLKWEVDNGYVIGDHIPIGRRTDVGHFGGFYRPE